MYDLTSKLFCFFRNDITQSFKKDKCNVIIIEKRGGTHIMNRNPLFFCNVEEKNKHEIIQQFQKYSEEESKQVYVIDKFLGTNIASDYEIDNVIIILIPKHPILLLSFGKATEEELDDFLGDVKEDLGILSVKYEYSKILKRPRKWDNNLFEIKTINDFNIEEYLEENKDPDFIKKIDLLISLFIGSINNIDRVGLTLPETNLDKIKRKIILFDAVQSQFIYLSNEKPVITIQGMAGTGKTELLLYRLKEIFLKDKDARIAFTCYNNVLAKDLKQRVLKFFNFLKIDEQIEWEKKMFVMPCWGSKNDPFSGMYRYICHRYSLPFYNYSECNEFDEVCKKALEGINDQNTFEPCFDYIFIDESQDFGTNFFELCEKITTKRTYIAGDIFQNIFNNDLESISPDFLLKNCYRTDPRTLMLAHSIGLGLYEKPPLCWLKDEEWELCGYNFRRDNDKFILSRSPLRRFEDIETEETFEMIPCNEQNFVNKILECIENIKQSNSTVQPGDIAIIISSNYKEICALADDIEYEIYKKYDWASSKGYITKKRNDQKIYISNLNNIKGLEFPFVIFAAKGEINNSQMFRNSIYMALTRSFLTTYFILDDINASFIDSYAPAFESIKNYQCLHLDEPTEEEKEQITQKLLINVPSSSSVQDILNNLWIKYNLSPEQKRHVVSLIESLSKTSISEIESKAIKIIEALID